MQNKAKLIEGQN